MKTKSNSKQLPENWAETRIKEICLDPQYGWTTSAVAIGTTKLLRTTDITSGQVNWETVPFCKKEPDNKEKYILKDGDIVISRAGSVGYSYLVKKPEQAVFASYLIRFRPLIVEDYLAYFLKSPSYWRAISEKKLGIAVPNVNATKLKEIDFPLPPLNEQKWIVAKIEELFTKLDAGIEALEKIRKELKRYRQAVLKHAFEGKLTAEWREKNKDKLEPASKLLERIAKEREKHAKGKAKKLPPLDTSTLPELPEGWEWAITSNVCSSVRDGTHDTPKYVEKGIPLVTSKNLKPFGLDFATTRNISFADHKQISIRSGVEKGDILFAMIGTIGNPVVVETDTVFSIKNVGLFKKNPSVISSKYLNFWLGSWAFNHLVESLQLVKGTTQKFIPLGHLRILPVPMTSPLEQVAIVNEIERHLSIADQIEQTIEQGLKQSDRLQQSILKQAFEGKLVPQDPSDEPAEKLLERIKAEKIKLQAGQKAKRKEAKRGGEKDPIVMK